MNELQKFEEANKDKLADYLREYNPGHDDTQMRYFIVGQGITDYGKYKQALAELNAHYEALKTHYINEKRHLLEIELEKEERELETSEIRKQLHDVEIEELQLKIDTVRKNAKRNLNELNKMFEMVQEYEKKIEGKDKVELEKDYHIKRFQKLLAVHTVWRGGNLSGVMDNITNLPEDMQYPLLNEFSSLLVTDQRNMSVIINKAQKLLEQETLNEQENNAKV